MSYEYYGYIDTEGDIHILGSSSGEPADPIRINWLKCLLIIGMVISGGSLVSLPLPYIMMGDALTYPLEFFLSMTLPILLIGGAIMIFCIVMMRSICKVEDMAKSLLSSSTPIVAEVSRRVAKRDGIDLEGNIDLGSLDTSSISDTYLREAVSLVGERKRILDGNADDDADGETERKADANLIASTYLSMKYRGLFAALGKSYWLTYIFTALSIVLNIFFTFEEQALAFLIPINLIGIVPIFISAINAYNTHRLYTSSKGRAFVRVLLVMLLTYLIVPFACLLFRDLYDLGNSMFLLAFTVADIALKVDLGLMKGRYDTLMAGEKYAPRFFLWRSLILFIALALGATLIVTGVALFEPHLGEIILAFDAGDTSMLPTIVTYFTVAGIISLIIITVALVLCNRAWHKKALEAACEDAEVIKKAGDII